MREGEGGEVVVRHDVRPGARQGRSPLPVSSANLYERGVLLDDINGLLRPTRAAKFAGELHAPALCLHRTPRQIIGLPLHPRHRIAPISQFSLAPPPRSRSGARRPGRCLAGLHPVAQCGEGGTHSRHVAAEIRLLLPPPRDPRHELGVDPRRAGSSSFGLRVVLNRRRRSRGRDQPQRSEGSP